MSDLSEGIYEALRCCGQDDVFENWLAKKVVVRWRRFPHERRDEWIIGEGKTLDDAGKSAALEFARRTREEGENMIDQAKRIEDAVRAAEQKRGGE